MTNTDLTSPGFHPVASGQVERVVESLKAEGWHLYVLPGETAVDRRSFLHAVSSSLPLDPPLVLHNSWDAMEDSLWQGLLDAAPEKIAILWKRSGELQRRSSRDFETAVSVFISVAESLGNESVTGGPTKRVIVLAA